MTPRLFAAVLLAPVTLALFVALNVAIDLLGGDDGNVPEWVDA